MMKSIIETEFYDEFQFLHYLKLKFMMKFV